MFLKKIDKKVDGYISEIDQMLTKFDATHTPSASQLAEMRKYQRLNELRDNPKAHEAREQIWEEF